MPAPRPHFWDAGRVIIQDRNTWTVRTWPGGERIAEGTGTAVPEPRGQRLLIRRDDAVVLRSGGGTETHVAEINGLQEIVWAGDDACLYLKGSHALKPPFHPGPSLLPVPETGCTAQRFGSYPEEGMSLGRCDLASGRSERLLTASGIEHLSRPVLLANGRVAVERYRFPIYGQASVRRVQVVQPEGDGPPTDLFPNLAGTTGALSPSPDGRRLAFLHSKEPTPFPFWHRLVIPIGGVMVRPIPPDGRLTSHPPVWSPDGQALAVTLFDGIRVGVLTVRLPREQTFLHWLGPTDGSCRAVALGPEGREALAIWESPGQTGALYRFDESRRTRWPAKPAPDTRRPRAGVQNASFEIVAWRHEDLDLEGILALPDGAGPHPLLVHVHGGPVNGLRATHPSRLQTWWQQGFAVFAPDYRGSGIGGREAMVQDDGDAQLAKSSSVGDILAGVDAVSDRPETDADRLYLMGESHGAFLVTRLVMVDHRFSAAVCWEGGYDSVLAYLVGFGGGGHDGVRQQQGGTPWQVPEAYGLASPAVSPQMSQHLQKIQTPLLLLHGDHETAPAVAFYTALREHGVAAELIFYRDEGHILMQRKANQQDVVKRCMAWFQQWQED